MDNLFSWSTVWPPVASLYPRASLALKVKRSFHKGGKTANFEYNGEKMWIYQTRRGALARVLMHTLPWLNKC